MGFHLIHHLTYLLKQLRSIFTFLKNLFRRSTSLNQSPKKTCYSDKSDELPAYANDDSVDPSISLSRHKISADRGQQFIAHYDPEPLSGKKEDPQLNVSKHIEGLIAVSPKPSRKRRESSIFPKYYHKPLCLEALTSDFGPPTEIDGRWERHIHPYGTLHFRDRERRILTDAYLYKDSTRHIIDEYVDKIEEYIVENQLKHKLPDMRTLVLELREDGQCGYYFVNHDKQCVFWLEAHNVVGLVSDLEIEMTLPMFEWRMKSEYWYHNTLFPEDAPLKDETINAVEDWLMTYAGVVLTTSTNISLFSLQEIGELLSLVRNVKSDDMNAARNHCSYFANNQASGAAIVIYHLMSVISHDRFIDSYGQRTALPMNEQILYRGAGSGLVMILISFLSSSAPARFFSKVARLSTIVIKKRGERITFPSEIIEEWRSYILFATVLLAANVGYLSVLSTDTARHLCYVSIAASLLAITSGMWLVNNHEWCKLILDNGDTSLVIQYLSIVLSLPSVLTAWSVFFSVGYFAFETTFNGLLVLVIICACVCLLIGTRFVVAPPDWLAGIKFRMGRPAKR